MPAQQRQDGGKPQERRPAGPGKPRSETPSASQRPPQESRRRRGEPRQTAWGDSIDRAWCAKALILLPEAFPVESHGGAAIIAPTIVERRENAALLCNFSHSGNHEWPAIAVFLSGGEAAPGQDDPGINSE